ncbi:hypothetical protein N657DRAFT_638725 [Parathielavia appendiculata]|uniref:Uncharacterized protein n=1 Tax=Parathielavia appendiculata TaxID=2587402 RepID=A0AAN6Z235_9PEZI|nr:hypothetical protein N657DRAFT_647225 [Parathielavia appendiculata]KAK4128281.1 hypothetical protein N657DRAFT_638725 [Parathielavia appendiculata]
MSPTLGQLAGETLWISWRSDMTRSRERISGEQETQIGTWNFPLSRISQLVRGARTIQSSCLLLVEDSVHLPW